MRSARPRRESLWQRAVTVLAAFVVAPGEWGLAAESARLIGYTEGRNDLPGGQFVNWVTNRACVVRADGTDRRELAEELARRPNSWTSFAGWSPDGGVAIIASSWESPENAAWERAHRTFRTTEGWLVDCCLLDLATNEVVNLTAVDRVSGYNTGLFFFPDGSGCGFMPQIDGVSKPYAMDRDGRHKRDVSGTAAGFAYGYSPSPDGTLISYHEDYRVYVSRRDGGAKRLIETGQPFNFAPNWSPDGEWLLFVAGEHYDCHPHVVRRDGTGLRKLADRGGYRGVVERLKHPDFHSESSDVPVWSADGRSIYYTAQVDGAVELMRAWLDGRIERLTDSAPGIRHYHPSPSPDGRSILFGSDRSGTMQLYVADADGGGARPVTAVPPNSCAMHGFWQPGDSRHRGLAGVAALGVAVAGGAAAADAPRGPEPPYPDVEAMIRQPLADVPQGTVACGWDALRYRMRGNLYASNPRRPDQPTLTQFERLVRGEPDDVAAVNREIVAYCRSKQAEIEAAWRDPRRQNPAKDVCQYQTELIPLAILTLRIGDRLTPEAHQAIRDVLTAFHPEVADVEPTMWMHAPGYNGANAHDYLSFLALTWAVTGDPLVRDAASWGLRGELDHLNTSGDISEFNVLEGHWCSSNGYDAMKAFVRDPELARMARLIAERLWINRFLAWSPAVERITGPGSRMAPGAWLGTSSDRLQFATGVEKPIWLNEYFDWGVWRNQAAGRWPLDDVEGMVPDLPAYLQDLAWRKQYPHDLRSGVQLIPWMNRYPTLPGVSDARPDPMLGELANYQTANYAIGSIDQPYEASGGMVYASAWWNDHRAPADAPLGSPLRFAALYPHYVFNGAAVMDRTELFFENRPDQPLKDDWTGAPGPWMREFAERGRAGVLQHRNTMLVMYSGRNRGSDDVHPVAGSLHRVSAGMFLFRWLPGLEGLFVNRQPVATLPVELAPGDWWFIHDGDTYAGIRPLEATHLRGPCRTTLEERTRQIALYQDNYVGDSIAEIDDARWVQARSGFVVELGDAAEYGSFDRFRDTMLEATVQESTEGFVRHVVYRRPGRELEVKWHCYEETYPLRKVDGVEVRPVRFLRSPEFAVGTGSLRTHDAGLTTADDATAWLLSATPSQTYVAYQPQPHVHVPLTLETPIGRIESRRFPFGKLVAARAADGSLQIAVDADVRPFWSRARWRAEAWQDIGTHPSDIVVDTSAPHVTATINGDAFPVTREVRDGRSVWVLDPYARLPRVRDRVGDNRPEAAPAAP